MLLLFYFYFCQSSARSGTFIFQNFSAIGFGGFVNVGVPISEGDAVTGEFGYYRFRQDNDNISLVPLLLGYRYTLDRSGYGLYLEPTLGYTIGGTDIGDGYIEQKAEGVTAGIGSGYIFPGKISFNIGLRYQRVFVSGDPSLNMLSLRISHAFSLRRNDD